MEYYNKLISDIEKSNLSNEEKNFLKLAASRHIVFNYELIADYYSHSEKEMQVLMENSALVIIDFDKALENGFAMLSSDLIDSFISGEEYE